MHWKVKATDPPEVKRPIAKNVSFALAVIFLGFALIHLIRIDKLTDVVSLTLGDGGAKWFLALVTIGEVFALPYLLRLQLSPLFRIVSGLLVILVPLAWVCLTIWAYGNGYSTGQFSSYISTPSTWWLITMQLLGLGACYWVLVITNFDQSFRAIRRNSQHHKQA